MKKTILFAALLVVLGAMTSCLRSDDLEMLRHPIHVTGTANPQYGIPVATGELNINDILTSFSSDYSGMITNDEIITVTYDTSMSDTIKALNNVNLINAKKITPKGNGTKGIWMSKDTTLVDTINLDFFNDVDFAGQINIEHIWLTLAVGAYGRGAEFVRPHVRARFLDLDVSYEDHNGTLKHFGGMPSAYVEINDIYDGFNKHFDSVDIASIVNDMPRRIITTYKFRFQVNTDILTSNILTMPYSEILDSIHMTELVYSADLHVSLPLSVEFHNMNYSFPIDLGNGLSSVNLDSIISSISQDINFDIDSARFRLTLYNGIPLNLTLSATLQDAGGNNIINLFNNKTIASANLASNPANPSQYVAISEKETVIESPLSATDIDRLSDAKKMMVTLQIDSQNLTTGNYMHVCIRKSDYLKLKGFLIFSPSFNVDIPVTNSGIL